MYPSNFGHSVCAATNWVTRNQPTDQKANKMVAKLN